ncbi:MAG: EAL domain-containing protein, partial [Aestuariivirga sp.]
MSKRHRFALRFLHLMLLSFGLLVLVAATLPAAAADGSLTVDAHTNGLSLNANRNPIVSDKTEISVLGPQEKNNTILKAQGPGPRYYWSLFSFENSEGTALDLVLAIEPQRFPGSGFWPVAVPGPQALDVMLTRDGSIGRLQVIDGVQTVTLHIPAKDTVNVAIESLGPKLATSLWQLDQFNSTHLGLAYYKGLLEGLIVLMLVGLLALFSTQPSRAVIAGISFAFAMALFVEGDIGVLAARVGLNFNLGGWFQPIAESLLVGATGFCVIAFLNIPQKREMQSMLLGAGALLVLANLAYALAEPGHASGLARIAMVIVGFAGLGLCLMSRGSDQPLKAKSLLFWLALCGWIIIAGVAALITDPKPVLGAQFAALCTVVLLILCLVLLRISAAQGLGARPFITDATMRSLALSSGRHVMWNWQPQANQLEVGKELSRLLDLEEPNVIQQSGNGFRDIVHPLDLPAYQKLAERHNLEPGERVTLEMRLRQGDGNYRWFELQARALANQAGEVDRCIGTLTDIGRLKEVETQLATDSLQDQLTGLATKGLLLDRIERALNNPRAMALRLVVIDIDRFKLINEGLGHEAGDSILKTVAARLQALVANGETLARLAGGQFALMAQISKARGDFADLVDAIATTVSLPIAHQDQQIVVTASIGVSSAGKGDIKPQDLIDQAQVAMLEARADGGGQAVFYHTEMRDDRARLISLESELRRAINQNEIIIYYQPIVYLGTLEVAGFEALARWQHPELGLLQPAEFVDVAETAGLMREIGLQMLQGAARQLGIWQRLHRPGPGFFVSVNVSASQLSNPDFPTQVQHVLRRENLESGSLKLEITETVLMRQPERSAALLRQLQALGVGLACDDFGTGYSSLSSLRDFPFDTLKMDRSFISLENVDDRNDRIISSITALSQA